MNAHALRQSVARHNALRDELIRRFGAALADDEQALIDTLDGLSDLDEQIIAVMRSADDDEVLVNGIKARVDELQARALRIGERAATKKAAVVQAMQAAGVRKIEAPDFTLSLRNVPPTVQITDEAALPEGFVTTKITRAPDKRALKEALQAGEAIPGATLGNGGVGLTVRRG